MPEDQAEGGRGLALGVAVLLLGLFVWPVTEAWAWEVIPVLSNDWRTFTYLGGGGAGAIALLAAGLPMSTGARKTLALLVGVLGLAALAVTRFA